MSALTDAHAGRRPRQTGRPITPARRNAPPAAVRAASGRPAGPAGGRVAQRVRRDRRTRMVRINPDPHGHGYPSRSRPPGRSARTPSRSAATSGWWRRA